MTFIIGVSLPNGEKGNILVDNGKIALIGDVDKPAGKCDRFYGNGYLVLPGLIDAHVHFRTPGGTHKETWERGTMSAIRGGVTTVADMPNTSPATTNWELLAAKEEMIGAQPVNYKLWLGATPTNWREFQEGLRHPRTAGVKMYMGSSTGDLLVDKREDQQRVFEAVAEARGVLAVHAEDEELMQRRRKSFADPQIEDHCQIRHKEVEISAVERALEMLRQIDDPDRLRLYFCHLSCPESLELVHDAKQAGANVVAEVCPHHLLLDYTHLRGEDGGYYKMNPPLRSPRDVTRMRELLCRGGFVDVIGSDHAPHAHAEKTAASYDAVLSGVPGVQTIHPILFGLVANGELELDEYIALTSGRNGLTFYGGHKGSLEPGADADFILIDPKEPVPLTHGDIASKMAWTPFAGHTGYGAIKAVFIGGKQIPID